MDNIMRQSMRCQEDAYRIQFGTEEPKGVGESQDVSDYVPMTEEEVVRSENFIKDMATCEHTRQRSCRLLGIAERLMLDLKADKKRISLAEKAFDAASRECLRLEDVRWSEDAEHAEALTAKDKRIEELESGILAAMNTDLTADEAYDMLNELLKKGD